MKLIRQTADNSTVEYIEPVELVDWFSQGESCLLQIGGTRVEVRFIGRKGRRARISISASPGTSVDAVQREAVLNGMQSKSVELNLAGDRQLVGPVLQAGLRQDALQADRQG